MDGKLALLYLLIVVMITFLYFDDENVGRMRHAIAAVTVASGRAAGE
jgi:hypothetical protein